MALSAKQFKEALDGLAKGDPSKIDFDGFFMELRKKGASPRELLRIEGRLSSLPGFSKEASRFRGVAARVATMPIPAPAPKPKGPKPKTPKPGKAGILSRLSGLAKGAKGLVRTPTFGGVAALGGLGFLASAALSDQKERQMRGIQRGLVNPALGQNILSEVDLGSQMGTTRRLNSMASLMEAGQAMTPQEAELSAILGAEGAAAAQNAAVGRNLDQVALDNVLRMT